jgi:hypothetical protein
LGREQQASILITNHTPQLDCPGQRRHPFIRALAMKRPGQLARCQTSANLQTGDDYVDLGVNALRFR